MLTARALASLLVCALAVSGAWAQEPTETKVEKLIEQLKSSDLLERQNAAEVLRSIGPDARAAVPALIEALRVEHSKLRGSAAMALANIGPEAVPALSQALTDESFAVRSYSLLAVERIGPDARAVPGLIAMMKNLYKNASPWTYTMGPVVGIWQKVPSTFWKMGPETVAAKLLERVGAAAVPALIEVVANGYGWARSSAVQILGRLEAKDALPVLIEVLKNENGAVRLYEPDWKQYDSNSYEFFGGNFPRYVAVAVGSIAQRLQETKDTSANSELRNAVHVLITGQFPHELIRPVRLSESFLLSIDENRWHKKLFRFAKRHSWISGIAIVELGLFAISVTLLCFSPLTLLAINEGLDTLFNENMRIKYKGFEGSAPVKLLLLVGFFHYQRRVLDAWVNKHFETARKNFKKKETVALRQTHVPIPVVLDGNSLPSIGPEQLYPTCKKSRWRVLIHGEGGAGKTSLACQMGHWAMADDKGKRLCEHRMLPALIEQELDLKVENPRHAFREVIRGQLQDLVGEAETISPRLLAHMLRKRRVLVIVDHLSEMSQETRRAMRPGDPEFLPFALVVTSRNDEKLDGVTKTTIKPRRIDGNRLSSFMESYLTQLGKRELFDDAEYFDACRKLSLMVAQRDITVLLAKLYADQLVSVKEQDDDSHLPDNIPDLMLQYLKILNRGRTEDEPDNAIVHSIAKIVAWECLQRTYRPGPAMRNNILRSLKDTENAEEHLRYLETRLRVIRAAGESDEKLLFELDPLAEYLAGLHLVELNRDNEEHWRKFFSRADRQLGAPESIKGFLLAVRDCCVAKKKEADCDMPDFVVKELDKRTASDPEVVRQGRLQQRVQRLITNLNVPEVEDRRAAAEALGSIGPDAKAAVPALIAALKDDSAIVRWTAAVALGSNGPDAKVAVPVLIEALKNENVSVRRKAAVALARIGPEAKSAVHALSEALKDENVSVRRKAAGALWRIGTHAVPALIEALKNENVGVRRKAAVALGNIGPNAKSAVPALLAALKDERGRDRRRQAAVALVSIGPEGVSALIKALKDKKRSVRESAADALWRIGTQAVPALIEALKDESVGVRRKAAVALGKIGPNAKSAVPALIEASENAFVEDGAHEALRKITGESDNHT